MKKQSIRRWLAALSAGLLLGQTGMAGGMVSAETTEKTVVRFSASDMEITSLLEGYLFYTNWQTGDGLESAGADLSGTADNGAHKKMTLKTTVTLTALDESVDLAACWKQLAFRLRSSHIDGQEKATNFYTITPAQVTMTNGTVEVSIPLFAFDMANINWADVRQLNVTCNVAEAYRPNGTEEALRIKFKLDNTRIVQEVADGEVDRDELTELVNATIDEAAYTAESVAAYKQAVEDGKVILQHADATQEQVDAAAKAIKTAKQNLISAKEVYKGTLQGLLDAPVSTDGYTETSAAAYRAALEAGQTVANNADSTQDQVNTAVKAIMAAKLALVSIQENTDFETVVAFPSIAKTYDNLLYGTTFYPGWQTGAGLSNVNTAGDGMDLSGDADNGCDDSLYLELRFAFTGLTETADPSTCWKQLGLRMRSTTIDKDEKSTQVFYLLPSLLTETAKGEYAVRIPLRYFSANKIDWTDVKDIFVLAEMNKAYYRTGPDGSNSPGVSDQICFTMAPAAIVRKTTAALKGDVNRDGFVTAEDALLALQVATQKITLAQDACAAADVDGTAGITANDALLILQCATQKIAPFETEKAQKMVALTFDDGPGDYIEEFLDALKERNAHVTFFTVGTQIEQHPDMVTRMATEGHTVGIHGYEHKKGMTSMTDAEMKAEVDKCADLIEQYTGQRTKYIRAPWEATGDRERAYFAEVDLREISYVGYIADFSPENQDKDIIVNAHLDADGNLRIQDGEILLLHEVYKSSVDAAIELIDRLQADGFEIVSIDELMAARANGGIAGARYNRVLELR